MPTAELSAININYNYWILQSIAMLLTCFLIKGLRITSPIGPTLAVVALAFVNSFAWDAALFFKIPNEVTYHTVTLLLANGAIFWVVVKVLPGIEVEGVFQAILAPIVFTLTSMLISQYGKDINCVAYLQRGWEMFLAAKESFLSNPKVSSNGTP